MTKIAFQRRRGKATAAEASRTRACILLLFALLNLTGCDRINALFGVRGKAAVVTPMPVQIDDNCAVSPDPIGVATGNAVVWFFSTTNPYKIQFQQKTDPTNGTNITPPATSVTNATGVAVWITKGIVDHCKEHQTIGGQNAKGCYYTYKISGSTACKDPGVLVQPE